VYTQSLIDQMNSFPDQTSVELLRERGVRSVILHLARVKGTAQQFAAERPITGLGITRYRIGDLLIYELGSSSTSAPPTAGRPGRSSAG
jgi:hypothetical protein